MKFDSANCVAGTITINTSGTILSFDEISEHIFGYAASELLGQNVVLLMPEPYRSECNVFLAGDLCQLELSTVGRLHEGIGLKKDGSTILLSLFIGELKIPDGRILFGVVRDISERKDLERVQSQFSAIIDASSDAIMSKTLEGIVTSWNPAAQRMFGYSEQDMLGQAMARLIPKGHENEEPEILAKISRGEHIPHFETERQRKNGEVFPISVTISPIKDSCGEIIGVSKIARDITELKRSAEELQQYRTNLEKLVSIATAEVTAIVQTAVNAIITIDALGIMHVFNPSAEKLFGWKNREIVGKNISMLMEDPFSSEHDGYLANYLNTGKAEIIGKGREVTCLRKDGSTFPGYLAVGHTKLTDKQHFFVGFISDITPQKKNEAELRQAKEDAEAGARAKSAFVANMSHEIRTPMNAVIGFAEVVLQDAALSLENRQHVKIILSSAKSLLGIINDILDASKLESGKFSLETVCFNMPNALADILRTVDYRAADKGIYLNLEYAATLPIRLRGDPHRLRQIILNLVENSIKFTENGGVTLSVRPGERPDMLHFSVKDTGIGMTQAQSEKVFEVFSQADASTTRRFGGTGLGTSIAKQIVELMGGRIWVESEIDSGSVFNFTARFSVATLTEGCLYEDGNLVIEGYVSPRVFRVLLAEDIEANATLVILRLKQQGHEIEWVKNGREAVTAFKAGHYDMILIDVMMPEMDGLEATRQIRALEGTDQHIPILALTASILREDRERCYAAGMDKVEGKPIDFNQLFASMEQLADPTVGSANVDHKLSIVAKQTLDLSPLFGVADYEKALKTWRDPLVYMKVLISFSLQHVNDVAEMAQLLLAHPVDTEPARGMAHALKGVAGNLALDRVASLAGALDVSLKSGEGDIVSAQLVGLSDALGVAIAAIAKLQLPIETSVYQMQTFDVVSVRALLITLLFSFEALNPDEAEPVMSKLSQYVLTADLAPIARCLENFDFDAAQTKTYALAEKLGVKME
ncbi:MAG: PAS domain S-box protein [Gallionella sp.]